MTPLFFSMGSWSLGGHKAVLDGDSSSEVNLYPMLVASSLHTFTHALVVKHNHVWFLTVLLSVGTVIVLLLGRCSHLHLNGLFLSHVIVHENGMKNQVSKQYWYVISFASVCYYLLHFCLHIYPLTDRWCPSLMSFVLVQVVLLQLQQ